MNVVIKNDLIPGLGHLQEVIVLELGPDDSRLARSGSAEIMGQFQLAASIVLRTYKLFHDLKEDTAGIDPQFALGAVEHFIASRSERRQSLV